MLHNICEPQKRRKTMKRKKKKRQSRRERKKCFAKKVLTCFIMEMDDGNYVTSMYPQIAA
jgi:hypothetical protein